MIYLSAIICIVGLIVYCLNCNPSNPKMEIGRIMFAFGLLAFLLLNNPVVDTLFHVTSHR